jgi:hypothetical protein
MRTRLNNPPEFKAMGKGGRDWTEVSQAGQTIVRSFITMLAVPVIADFGRATGILK